MTHEYDTQRDAYVSAIIDGVEQNLPLNTILRHAMKTVPGKEKLPTEIVSEIWRYHLLHREQKSKEVKP